MVAFSIFYQESWAAVLIPQMVICMTLAFSNWFIQPCLIERLNVFRTGVYSMAAVSCFLQSCTSFERRIRWILLLSKRCTSCKSWCSKCEPFFVSSGISFSILVVGWTIIGLMTFYFSQNSP